jgi:uncharacterized membrane protein
MNWIKELFWDSSLSVRDNLATWALGVIGFTLFYESWLTSAKQRLYMAPRCLMGGW